MPDASILFNITPVPVLSVLVWIFLCIAALYFARRPFHESMGSLGRVIYNSMRMAAASVKMAQQRLEARNRQVLLAAGMEHAERRTEREFERIHTAVERNLESYPQLQRQLRENLLMLEEDYQKTEEIPQSLSDWVKVIEAIAGIKPSGDPIVADLLEDIHNTLKDQNKIAIEGHRKAVADRHGILSRMVPQWRATDKTLKGIEKAISDLTGRSQAVDRCIADYETIKGDTDMAERQLSSSSLTQFFTSGLVLCVFAIGAIINFNLVALPMSEMVGGASYIGAFKTSDVAGMFIVCLEIVVGIFLMDALRFTRLFSVIGTLDDKKRNWFFWILLGMLTILAGVESSLAFMRDRIAGDMEALRQSLAGVEPSAVAASNIPTIGQMILGFILPFILTTVAMPFETFISSSRTVIGMTGAWSLRALAFFLRLAGTIGYYTGRLVVNAYDLVIFPALWLEALILRKPAAVPSVPKDDKNRPAKQKKPMTMLEETGPCEKTAD
ncbi:MAG: hypothetical protein ABIL58_06280 [Pseudomonadota bacterium]